MKNNRKKRKRYAFDVVVKNNFGVERTLHYDIYLTSKEDNLGTGTFIDWMEHGIMTLSFGKTEIIPGHELKKTVIYYKEQQNAKG